MNSNSDILNNKYVSNILLPALINILILITPSEYMSWEAKILSLLFVMVFVFYAPWKPYYKLYQEGKMRGLWHYDTLDGQIAKKIKTSKKIELKLSSGYHLFVKKNKNFYECLNDEYEIKNKIRINILLVYPCLQSEHVKARAATNKISEKDYVKRGLETLIKLYKKNKETESFIIQVKYYGEKDVKWRFYIFDDEIIYLAYYAASSLGIHREMYKIKKGNNSLCEPFHEYFEDIWNNGSIDAINYIENHYAMTNDSGLTKCKDCQSDICKNLKDEYLIKIKSIKNI